MMVCKELPPQLFLCKKEMMEMHKKRRLLNGLFILGILLSMIPVGALSNTERTNEMAAAAEIHATDVVLKDSMGSEITKEHPVKSEELITIDLSWAMKRPALIEEGTELVLPLPQNLRYLENNGVILNGKGHFQIEDNSIHVTLAQNYQINPDSQLPDYGSLETYEGTLSLQATVRDEELSEHHLDFGNGLIKPLFVLSDDQQVEKKNAMDESENTSSKAKENRAGRHLNELDVWVIRHMEVLDKDGNPFTEQNPPTRDDNIQINFNWMLEDDVELEPGDYYTYQLPDYFAVHNEIRDKELENDNPGGQSLGTFDLSIDGLLTLKFNKEACNLYGRAGTVHLFTQLDVSQEIEQIVVEKDIDEDGNASGEVEVGIARAEITKRGSVDKNNIITWEIIINANNRALSNVRVTDFLGAYHEFLDDKCEVPDGKGGWKAAESGFYTCRHSGIGTPNHQFDFHFPLLEKANEKLTHAVKFIVRSKITDMEQVSSYSNTAGIEADNVLHATVTATVDNVEIKNYKFLKNSEFEKGILNWRIKATLDDPDGTIIDQMYKLNGSSDEALHYLDKTTLKITDENNKLVSDSEWEFIDKEEVRKKGEIVRFGIKFKTAGVYFLEYQTKAFINPLPLDEDIPNYLWVNGELYDGSSDIDDDNLLGVIKNGERVDYSKREISWKTIVNLNKITMKNAKITDLYSRVNGKDKCALRLNEKTLHIYPQNEKGEPEQTNELVKGKDYTLESIGKDYKEGFIITLINDYANTKKTLEIHYNTHFKMEEQSKTESGKRSTLFINSAIVEYKDEAEKNGYDSDEAEKNVKQNFQSNGWKYGAFVGKGDMYKNQVSPYENEKPIEDSIYWSVAMNIWSMDLPAGTIVSENLHDGQYDPEVKVYKVTIAEDNSGFKINHLGDELELDRDYQLVPNGNDSSKFDIKLLKDIHEPFAVFVKTRACEDVYKFKNNVKMDFGEDESVDLDAFVEKCYKTTWLSKDGKQVMQEKEALLQANYELVLNKNGYVINSPVITDTVIRNEQTFQQEEGIPKVRVFKAILNSSGQYEEGEEIDLTKEGRSAKITNDMENGTQTLTIVLGGRINEPYLIKYATNIDPGLKNGTQITNRAKLWGMGHEISESSKRVEVKSTQGSGTSTGVDGSLKIRKVDENKALINDVAEFDIFRVDVAGNLHDFLSIKVRGDRIVQVGEDLVDLEKIENLRYGTYAIQETKAPDGYQLDNKIHHILISDTGENAQKDYVYTKENKKIKPFELSILKQSSVDSALLQDGEFILYDKDPEQPLARAVTDQKGIGIFMDKGNPYVLEFGKGYQIKEIKAPEGFIQLKSEFTLMLSALGEVKVSYDGDDLDDGDVTIINGEEGKNNRIQFVARNTPRTPLPKTGGAGLALLLTIGIAAIAIAVWYYFPLKKRRDGHENAQ